MIQRMRTTILLEDRLGRAARSRARREGISFSALVARALREDLTKTAATAPPPPFRLVTVGGSGFRQGANLDRTSELLVAEDEATYGKGQG
jgi:hypothetical protein